MTNKIPELPLVALIGPTNAGKSTLFNRLTGSWQAITAKEESTTRDRVYSEVEWQGNMFALVDTGGLVEEESELYQLIKNQTLQAVEEADLILFLYDAHTGLQGSTKEFLDSLRGDKRVWLVANKVDSFSREKKIERLDKIGFSYFEVSGLSGRGTGDLLDEITKELPFHLQPKTSETLIALVGRPNVGKSTLLNALTDSERAVVSPVAGTTRDIVTAKLTLDDRKFLLADTAGVRRRGRIDRGVEAFSVKRTLTAIAQADAVMVLVDASEGTTRGDLHLIYFAKDLGKPVLLVFNKADLVETHLTTFHRHLVKFEQVAVSALHKENIGQVIEWIKGLNSKPDLRV